MNEQIFPYANVAAGVLIFLVGFLFHFAGQLTSLVNRQLAMKIERYEYE